MYNKLSDFIEPIIFDQEDNVCWGDKMFPMMNSLNLFFSHKDLVFRGAEGVDAAAPT